MAVTAPVTVTLTCPVCGETEEATGTGNLSSSYVPDQGLLTWLSYNASTPHDCSGITAPAP